MYLDLYIKGKLLSNYSLLKSAINGNMLVINFIWVGFPDKYFWQDTGLLLVATKLKIINLVKYLVIIIIIIVISLMICLFANISSSLLVFLLDFSLFATHTIVYVSLFWLMLIVFIWFWFICIHFELQLQSNY